MAENQQPQRDPDLASFSSFRGLRNDVTAERFDPSDLALGNNIDIDKSGRIARRSGFVKKNATATHSVWSDDQETTALCVQGSSLMNIGADLSLSALGTGLTAGLRMGYVKVNDSVYHSNGREKGVLQNGAVRSWGLPVPGLPRVSLGVGQMPAGTYQFVMTYVRVDGQESGAGAAGVIVVPANGALVFAFVPSADPAVALQNIYITTANGKLLYRAMTVSASSTGATYANDTKELTYRLKTQFLSPPPAGNILAYYSGRLYVGSGNRIYPSEPFAYELFNLRKAIALDGQVTMIGPLEDKERFAGSGGLNSGLFVGTDRSCGLLVGNTPEMFQYVPKTDYGAIKGAIDFVDGSLYGDNSAGARKLPMWLTTAGICVGLPDMEIRNLTRTKYGFSAAGLGAALFTPGPNRFIAVSNF